MSLIACRIDFFNERKEKFLLRKLSNYGKFKEKKIKALKCDTHSPACQKSSKNESQNCYLLSTVSSNTLQKVQ